MQTEFEEYVSTRSGALVRFAHLLCGDRHLAEDLVQEVLAKAYPRWRRVREYDPDLYLRRSLIWANSAWWRRRSSREAASAQLPDAPTGTDFAGRLADRAEMWQLLAALPRRQRTVLVLRFFEDLDDDRIAQLLECSPVTVRVHAHRGLDRLRTLLHVPSPAELPAPPAVPLDGVRRRADRNRRRRIATGVVAALVGILLLAVPLLARVSPPPVISPTPTPAPSAQPTASDGPVTLTPSTLQPTPFPYEPGVSPQLPDGLRREVSLRYLLPTLSYWDPARPSRNLQLQAGVDGPGREGGEQVTVGGATGFRWTDTGEYGSRILYLSWQRDGRWLRLTVSEVLTETEAIAFAANLRPAALGSTSRLGIGLAPAGWDLLTYGENEVTVHGRAVDTGGGYHQYPQLTVQYGYGGRAEGMPDLTVAGHPAQYVTTGYSAGVAVYLDDRHVVTVYCLTDVLRLPREILIRVAESVSLDGVPLSRVTAPAEP
ncbi:hypothetical protein Cs7R123_13960 [Catellatospora sp. TT07R-123]|uniref:SigE family RNA polymerase sigma factor n=1 Tax=Catellatospora sp. TT07R-123 TaxID=2733863 RepID=UPI001B1E557B|nr:SigE family RNA polymerase sigma factor [Catellatospora sp. TT07R-123]GHJ44054.1 hypothetical protein Cs7R123_13960 [Catellatospora sp. TT07R-123]